MSKLAINTLLKKGSVGVFVVSVSDVVTSWVSVIMVCVACVFIGALCYYDYLTGLGRYSRILFFVELVMLTFASYTAAFPLVEILRQVPLVVVGSSLTFSLVLAVIYLGHSPKCLGEEERVVDNVKLRVCLGGMLNAWYHPVRRKIVVGEGLLKILSRDELRAVVLHEEGHAKNYFLTYGSAIILYTVWFHAALTVVVTVTLIPLLGMSWNALLVMIGFLIPLLWVLTTVVILWSWSREHESDVYALKNSGFEPIVNALIKIHVYGELEKRNYLKYVKTLEITPVNLNQAPKLRKVRFQHVLKELIKYSLIEAPLTVYDVLKKPLPRTHPPLHFRLAKLSRTTSIS